MTNTQARMTSGALVILSGVVIYAQGNIDDDLALAGIVVGVFGFILFALEYGRSFKQDDLS